MAANKNAFKWTDEMIAELREKYVSVGPVKLSQAMGIPYWVLLSKSRRIGIEPSHRLPRKGKEWKQSFSKAIKERYVSEGGKGIAEEFGVGINRVRCTASRMGLHTIAGHAEAGKIRAENSDAYDLRYFDEWSPNMAYILGFLFADGNINQQGGMITLCQSEKDESVLCFIRDELKAKNKIYHTTNGGSRQSTLIIGSTVLARKLMERGIRPRKTYNNDPFPEVPDEMMPHFARGYLDGDGTICVGSNGYCYVGFVGSEKFIRGLRERIIHLVGVSPTAVQIRKGKTADWAHTGWTSLRDMVALEKFLYPSGHGFCLERKKERLVQWLGKPRLPSQKWSGFEDEFIRRFYRSLGPKKVSDFLGKTAESVRDKARQLNVIK